MSAHDSLLNALRRAVGFIELVADEAKADGDMWGYDRAGYVLDKVRPVVEAHGEIDTVPDEPEPHESALTQLRRLLGVWYTDSPTWPPEPGIEKALRLAAKVEREHIAALAEYIGAIKDSVRNG